MVYIIWYRADTTWSIWYMVYGIYSEGQAGNQAITVVLNRLLSPSTRVGRAISTVQAWFYRAIEG